MASSVVPPIANRLVHPIAHAFSISGANGIYNSARPSYPPAALAHLFSSFPTSPNQLSVAELGAGTGIFTRLLLANGIGRIRDLLVVEPSAGMREGFEKVVEAPGEIRMRVVDGTFDSIDSPDASMDAVLIAQAFHWIGQGATAGESAIKEIARVLKPGGVMACIWNLEDREAAQWVAQLRDTYEIHESGTPQYRHGYWKSIYDLPIYSTLFTAPEQTKYTQILETDEELVVSRVLSKSFITALEPIAQAEVLEKVREVVRRGEGKIWIDEEKGKFQYPYTTDLFTMRRK